MLNHNWWNTFLWHIIEGHMEALLNCFVVSFYHWDILPVFVKLILCQKWNAGKPQKRIFTIWKVQQIQKHILIIGSIPKYLRIQRRMLKIYHILVFIQLSVPIQYTPTQYKSPFASLQISSIRSIKKAKQVLNCWSKQEWMNSFAFFL